MIVSGIDPRETTDHPHPERLAAFGLGKVEEAESTLIARHIEGCDLCRSQVETVVDDSLAGLLRGADRRTSTDEDRAVPDPGRVDSPPAYEVLEMIGQGGMGLVYRARQVDLGRIVALKQVRPEILSVWEGADRFRREAEAVARLRHPNIVPIYQFGWWNGLPYYAMEYIAGGTLGDRLARGRLEPGASARLVACLALAVQHAHDAGVIHRDLKPANILLAPDLDCPKIGDFGLAKQSNDTSTTRSGTLLGTPAYMSPEQASGDSSRVGPASDVYALGVILYECLVGRPPWKASTVLETLELIRVSEPTPPRRLRGDVPKDLETIALKCLEKSPERRYPSARALAEELRRFLDGEPIAARAVSAPERLAKWARRRPWQALSVALGVVVVLGGWAGTLVHNARLLQEVRRTEREAEEARNQRTRAENQYRSARSAIRRMIDRFDDPAFAGGPLTSSLGFRRRLLEDALAFYDGVVGDDEPSGLSAKLDKIEALIEAGNFQIMIDGGTESAISFRRALKLLDKLDGQARPDPSFDEKRIQILTKLGLALTDAGKIDEAVSVHEQAIELAERRWRADRSSIHRGDTLAWSRHNLGSTLMKTTRASEAESHLNQAVEVRRGLAMAHPENTDLRKRLAESLINLALIHGTTGKSDRADAEYTEAADLLVPIVGDHPEEASTALSLAKLHLNRGSLALGAGRSEFAIKQFQAGRTTVESLLRRTPDWPDAKTQLGQLSAALAYALGITGRHREALPYWDQAVPLSVGDQKMNYRLGRAASLAQEGKPDEALAEAESIAGDPLEPSGLNDYNLACVAGLVHGQAGPSQRVETSARRALEWLDQARVRGVFRDPRMIESLQKEEDFRTLRLRDDFRLFLDDLAFPSDPFATSR